ncbi:CHAD domain-containing protein [Actinacidiphila yeochonensis]|uniref:CHAD domain-containing protein n=1 Tax=Actinacidiphila yeochonensis TaxID=89050 RepID=UPI000691DFB1|nr:CHAD domain-containing protein [Actinacidiphila yeochonensis]
MGPPHARAAAGAGGTGEPPASAGQAVLAYLRTQREALAVLEPEVRRDREDAVHRMRVATRRARSALKSHRRLLDRAATDPLGDELRWLAALLGAERDREVLGERLAARAAELRPAPAALTARLTAARSRARPHAEVVRALDGDRYTALLRSYDTLLSRPPFRPAAADDPVLSALRTTRRDHHRLRLALGRALDLPPGPEQDAALHQARKEAKRARYSSEAAEPVLGRRAAAQTSRMTAAQKLLGEHQDSVMARAELARLRAAATAAGEDPAPYEAMALAEARLASAARERLYEKWRRSGQAD